MIISKTPFRISFFGGGTDFPEFYKEHGGTALLTTINKYCYISVHELSPFFKHKFRASYAQTERVLSPDEFKHPLIRESLLHVGVKRGMEISHVADLPGRTGLGSSSAFTVGLLNSLHTFRDEACTPQQLVEEAIHIERERVGDTGGHQDQYAAAYGGFVRIHFGGDGPATVTPIDIDQHRVKELEDRLLLFYTGIEKSAEQILTEQQKKISKNTDALLEMIKLADEAEKVLTGSGPINAFGELLHETWQRKRGLSSGITNPIVDSAYDSARSLGAQGGKLLGAGGRGFLLFFAEPELHDSIIAGIPGMKPVSFSINSEGSQVIFSSREK